MDDEERGGRARDGIPLPVPLVDCALAAVAAAAVACSDLDVGAPTVAALTVAAAALAWRRVLPALSASVVLTAVAVVWAGLLLSAPAAGVRGWTLALGGALLLVSTYGSAAWGGRWVSALSLPAAVVAGVAVGLHLGGREVETRLLASVAAPVLSWVAGQWRRSQRRYVASLLERARRAETGRRQVELLATARERTRIARELHDIVAHSLAVMTTQADGARFVVRSAPDDAVIAMAAISEVGRDAQRDMGGLLAALVEVPEVGSTPTPVPPGPRAVDHAPVDHLRPQPGIGDLERLVGTVSSTGLDVRLERSGDPVPLSPGAELVVYRVVQEALTNVVKHAVGGARVVVALAWAPGALRVRVEDDGPARGPAGSPGRGLRGMRERVGQLGGSLAAGPRPDGGFRVCAEVPGLGAAAATGAATVSGAGAAR